MGASGPRQREHPRRQPPRSVRSRGSRRGCQARERHRPHLKGKYFLAKEFTHPAPSYRTAITQPTSNPQSAENLNSKSQHVRQCGNSSSHLNICLLTSDKESINKRRGSTEGGGWTPSISERSRSRAGPRSQQRGFRRGVSSPGRKGWLTDTAPHAQADTRRERGHLGTKRHLRDHAQPCYS